MYEITYIETGNTETLTEKEAEKQFGKDEWQEVKQGYLPHIVAIEV